MEKKRFDCVVIGAGPGGYVAAIKVAQNGKSVALVEKNFLGGTCLNVGCIPTKTLLSNTSLLHKIKMAEEYGIHVGDIKVDFLQMKTRKDKVIKKIRSSLGGLLKSNQIKIFSGKANFISPTEIKIFGEDNVILEAENVVIATGSEPVDVPAFPCDHQKILNSTSVLELTKLPKSIVIVGGGYIGCEFATLYAELGVQVTVLEALPSILTNQGKVVAQVMTRAFQKQGIRLMTNVMVEAIDNQGEGVRVKLKGGESVEAEFAVVAIGRKVKSSGLELNKAGVQTGPKEEILVNEKMETNIPGIYAIGDVTGKFLLAHVASHQGIVAASNIIGQEMQMDYDAVPAVIFTHPEIATVGMTLEEALDKGYKAVTGKFPFAALGKAVATMDTEGFAEIIIDKNTGQILGAQVIGHEASNLIAEMTLAMQNELTAESVCDTIHAHPTMSESWMEAMLIAKNTPIHMPPKS